MATLKYTIEFDGQTFTRKSDRKYTHLVIARYMTEATHRAWYPKATEEEIQGMLEKEAAYGWSLLGYAGSLNLAQKRAAGWEAKQYSRVEIVPIYPDMIQEVKSRAKKAAPAESSNETLEELLGNFEKGRPA